MKKRGWLTVSIFFMPVPARACRLMGLYFGLANLTSSEWRYSLKKIYDPENSPFFENSTKKLFYVKYKDLTIVTSLDFLDQKIL